MREITAVYPSEYQVLIEVWERSVRATHDFLTEDDIQFFKPLILNEYFQAVNLSCMKDKNGAILGFAGVADNKLEMLFIDPAYRGEGVGKALLAFVISQQGVTLVDVNEQNEQAVGFYLHNGFKVLSRSEVDGMGKPFPLLMMGLV
ncbi:GNAT family N-acetyltransferase [Chitinophaga sp. Cy-1792]|uniref:GNAT family N-acetyltransferase n=1 Tax=Chitinophaga sp. Cy-1792 TaxID=2608339 RepID=UPI0014205030|nr:GNAT family N-acetyltransferase [Chitinophaga sp. Cy-1792]NIG53743.1 GNAT family N-acetyltransferase [Chitinophaga sp. Cy-1792]